MASKKNWSKINRNLIARGSINIWLPEDFSTTWLSKVGNKTQGHPKVYSDAAIQLCLTIQCWLNKPLRQACGFIRDLIQTNGLCVQAPYYSTLSRRYSAIDSIKVALARRLNKRSNCKTLDILLDSTGLKFCGPGHWLSRKNGSGKCKWVKLHIAVDHKTQQIQSWLVTPGNTADSAVAKPLIDRISGKINRVIADGAYDSSKLRQTLWERNIDLIVPPQVNARLQTELPRSQCNSIRVGPHMADRDYAIHKIRESRSKKPWMEQSGYHSRSLVETAMSRLKVTFGSRLRFKNPESINAELATKIYILNSYMNQNQREQNL